MAEQTPAEGEQPRGSAFGRAARFAWRSIGPWAIVLGAAVLIVIAVLRLVAIALGVSLLTGLAVLLTFFDTAADYSANAILSNARPPTDSELPHIASAIPYSSEDVQVLGGQGLELGCSILKPIEWLAFPKGDTYASVSLRMRQACVFHDYCYRHGAATYGYGQADCDYMLLDHAYRICRFINSRWSVANCVSQARKVALGVIFGGADSFKRADGTPQSPTEAHARDCVVDSAEWLLDDRCSSTYFEFDPYPVRSGRYAAYRIADAPQRWASEGLTGKTLYVFQNRPSGTMLTIVGWKKDYTRVCAGISLPSRYGSLTVTPRVVRLDREDGTSEDWFVWWRRTNLDETGGELAMLPPGRASLSDWQGLFAGASRFQPDPKDCTELEPVDAAAGRGEALQHRTFTFSEGNGGASGAALTHDARISEIYPAPGLARKGTILLLTLRIYGCGEPLPIRTCYHEIEIDPRRESGEIFLEPYKIRDGVHVAQADDAPALLPEELRDPDRYRNYVTPPIPMRGPGGRPALAWLRRGEALGETYDESALLRRAYREEATGRGFGLVLLRDFPEAADPVFILGRNSERPRLQSIGAKPKSKLTLKEWHLPPPLVGGARFDDPLNRECAAGPAPQGLLNSEAQAAVCPKVVNPECLADLDDTWMIRPPSVIAEASGGSTLVFTRTRAEPEADAHWLKVSIEARAAEIDDKGCRILSLPLRGDLALIVKRDPESRPESSDNKDDKEKRRADIAAVRAMPMLAARLSNSNRLSLILPDARYPGRSFLLSQ